MRRAALLTIVCCLRCGGPSFEDSGLTGPHDAGDASTPDAEAAAEASEAEAEACTPTTDCEDLDYVCGAIDDGCGNEVVCGPAYVPHPEEDWPTPGSGCTQQLLHSWACGPYPFPGGPPPFPNCVHWPGSATWCCAESG